MPEFSAKPLSTNKRKHKLAQSTRKWTKNIRTKNEENRIKNSNIKARLTALKEELPVFGRATVEMSSTTRMVHTTIIVIARKITPPPLIGRQTLEMLGMPLIDQTGGVKSPNKNIKNVKQKNSEHQTEL